MSFLVPTDYASTLESIKRLVHEARYIEGDRSVCAVAQPPLGKGMVSAETGLGGGDDVPE